MHVIIFLSLYDVGYFEYDAIYDDDDMFKK